MKFTVLFITLLSTSWAVKVKKTEDPKDKREAPVGYPSSGHSSQSFQAPSYGHQDASAISIGAGYSVGGAKPSFSYGAPESAGTYQLSTEGHPSSGHATIQLAPITLQSSHGGIASSDDLAQLMSQLSQGINSGAISLSPYQSNGQGAHGGQELSYPQFSFAAPQQQQQQQYSFSEQAVQGIPSYAAGTKGLGSYGSTGPVLFNPAESQSNQHSLVYGAPSSGGYSFGNAGGLSLGGSGHSLSGLSLGGGHSLAGLSLGGSGHSLGGSGYTFGGSGNSLGGSSHSLGNAGHSFGGSYKSYPGKASFKPSAYIGSSDSSHGLSGLSGSYGTPSFGSHSLSGGHGGLSLGSAGHGLSFGGSLGSFGGGSMKFIAPSYIPPKSEGFGSSLESIAAFSSGGHLSSSPPGTTYGVPSSSYGSPSTATHAASSHTPHYYVMSSSKHGSPSFGDGSSSHRAPSSGHGSLSSFSSGPKYSFGGHSSPSSRYGSPKDTHGAHSETIYNTIKYSEELKPRAH